MKVDEKVVTSTKNLCPPVRRFNINDFHNFDNYSNVKL